MAYREHVMREVFEVLRPVHAGKAYCSMARGTGRSLETVRRYVRPGRGRLTCVRQHRTECIPTRQDERKRRFFFPSD